MKNIKTNMGDFLNERFNYLHWKDMEKMSKEEIYDKIISNINYYGEHSEEWCRMGDSEGEIILDDCYDYEIDGHYIWSLKPGLVKCGDNGEMEYPIEKLKKLSLKGISNVLSNMEGTMYNNR
jgi:hypothetical protein